MGKFLSVFRKLSTLMMVVLLSSCGGSDTQGTSSGGISTIDQLPEATSPVTDSSATGLVSALKDLATTGMSLGSTDESFFTPESSLAACEMLNMTQSAITGAVDGDLILCFIKNTFREGEGSSVDIYDGATHAFTLDFTGASDEEGGGGAPDHVKFSIQRGSDGQITAFQMNACRQGAQMFYLNQTISGNQFNMTSKSVETNRDDGNEFLGSVSVEGTLGSDGKFTGEKTIDMQASHSADWGNFSGNFNFIQRSDGADMRACMTGGNAFEGTSCTFTNKVVGSMQLLDANAPDTESYNIGLLALGDGAVTGEVSGSCGSDLWGEDFVEGWLGDTGMPDPASSFIADVQDDELPSDCDVSVSFETSESYGCDQPVEGTITAQQMMAAFEACAGRELDHEHIDCWRITGDESP